LQLFFAPKRRPVADQAGQENVPFHAENKEQPAENGKKAEQENAPAGVEAAPREAQPAIGAAPAAAPTVPLQRLTLGSLDPTSPSKLLVTLVNRGAAVERVELNNPRYKSVEDQSGYWGHLALADWKRGGAQVQVVGAGTPAALAGLVVGDVIQYVDGHP